MRFTKKRFPVSYYCFVKPKPAYNLFDYSPLRPKGESDALNDVVNYCANPLIKKSATYFSYTFLEDCMKNWPKICHQSLTPGIYFALWNGGECIVRVFDNSPSIKGNFEVYAFGGYSFVGAVKIENGKIHYLNGWKPRDKDGNILKEQHIFHTMPVAALLFKQFAEIETKVLSPGKKIKEFNGKYKSDVPFDIDLCDLNWYTESIQGHPFVVRWHWRAQRYGKGLSKVKMIKIDEYMKSGIKRGAYKAK